MIAVVVCLAVPVGANAAQCDYTGFERPCRIAGGIYRMLAPEGAGPFPVLVYLYGSGGHTVSITNHPIFQQTVVDRGYILVVPAALDLTYVGGVRDSGWSLRHEVRQARDEIAFLRRVMENVARRFPIDRDRVLIAGQSRGGFLAWEIACHAPELATAFAVHGGGYLGPLPRRCGRPVRMLHAHGLSDPVVPMDRRTRFSGGADLPALSDSLDLIAHTNGCRMSGLEAEGTEFFGFDRRSWKGCRSGSSLDLMLHPGGHGMPWIWFRAILDWFEETPEAETAAKPVTRILGGDRPEGRFKRPPAGTVKAAE
jgi:polyhydroxybutyrate depolymerase